MAAKLGLSPDALSGQLAGILPQIVDKLTPQGNVPNELSKVDGIEGLLKGFLGQRACRQVKQPGTNHAASPPQFCDFRQGQVVLKMFRLGERGSLCVGRPVCRTRVGVRQEVKTFGIRFHQGILDPVMHHLHEVS